jgi:hypothetical protein
MIEVFRSSMLLIVVMPGLVPGIHVFLAISAAKDVDGRDRLGHDELRDAS